MAKPSQDSAPTLLVTELWGVGDLALAVPFLRAAAPSARVTLIAKPHAAPILRRFAPDVELLPFVAPWTAFRGKYRLLRWPWAAMTRLVRDLRRRRFGTAVSARPDPRDHALLAFSGSRRTLGFARAGSGPLLTDRLSPPSKPHRSDYWAAVAATLGLHLEPTPVTPRYGRKVIIHVGAGQPARLWPRARFQALAASLESKGWEPEIIDDSFSGLDRLIEKLDGADRFIGNDSGPGHLAALLGVPTFTIFGPQLPELFAPVNPASRWIEGPACPYKPCRDYCRFSEPRCLTGIETAAVLEQVLPWLSP